MLPVVVVAPGAIQSVLSEIATVESVLSTSVAELLERTSVTAKPLGLVVLTVRMLEVATNAPGVTLGRF